MNLPPRRALDGSLERAAVIGAAGALLLALIASLGWALGLPAWRQVFAGWPPVDPISSWAIAAAAGALLLRLLGQDHPRERWSGHVLAFLAAEAGLLRLQELATGWNAGLDAALLPVPVAAVAVRMAPLTALALSLNGFALLVMDRGPVRGWWVSQLASWLAFGASLFALAAHGFGASVPRAEVFDLMAAQSAAALAALALASLLARPAGGVMRLVTDSGPAGRVLRRALPAAVAAPLLLGWLQLRGVRAGWLEPDRAIALSVAAWTVLAGAALWWSAWLRTRDAGARVVADRPEVSDEPAREVAAPADAAPAIAEAESHEHEVIPDLERERREREVAAREHARERECREAILSHVSQQLGAPMAGLVAGLAALREGRVGPPLPPAHAEWAEAMAGHAGALETMVSDLLEAARAQQGRLLIASRRVALRSVIAETIGPLERDAARRGVTIAIEPIFVTQDVEADPRRMAQVLAELVENAVRLSPEGGPVRVAAGLSHEQPPYVVITVADTGPGIPPDQRDRIFDPFHASSDDVAGLGLGLTIARQLARLMGGRLWFESEPGGGTTFHFELPVWSRRPALARIAPRCVPGEPLALVQVELAAAGGRALGPDEEPALIEAYRVIGTCVLPDKDVLLPREGPADGQEQMHLLARTHLEGAEVLRARVSGELAACAALRDAGIGHRVTAHALPAYDLVPGMDPEDFLEGLITSTLAEQLLNQRREAA